MKSVRTHSGEGGLVPPKPNGEGGFTMIELLVSTAVLLVVSGIVVGSTMDMTRLGQKMTNRSDMHSGVRNATALLQQEVGQAGRVSLPAPVTLTGATGIGVFTVAVTPPNTTDGMFVGEHLIVGTGAIEETVTLTAVDTGADTITANFAFAHAAGAPVAATGGFSAGVIPTTMANGSTGNVLKIVGDVNGDGRMVYVEYTCDLANGRLYRNVMAYNAGAKPAVTVEQILLTNLMTNPVNAAGVNPPCFTYQERTFSGTTWVIGVAIMTTVRSQQRDQNTGDFQRVTKALAERIAAKCGRRVAERQSRQHQPGAATSAVGGPTASLRNTQTMRTLKTTDRSGEQGIALVMALLMVLAVSVVTGSLVMVARSEALSSTSYTSMSQVRYGAESGVHAAANYLLFMYRIAERGQRDGSVCQLRHDGVAGALQRPAGRAVERPCLSHRTIRWRRWSPHSRRIRSAT